MYRCMEKKLVCPKCKGERTVKSGFVVNVNGKRQRYKCQICGSTFYKEGEENGKS